MTGEGVEQFIRAVREGRGEYEREYRQARIFVTKIRCFLSRKTEQFEVLVHLKVPFFSISAQHAWLQCSANYSA